MRTRREERLRQELDGMERDFRARLVAELEQCAAGHWGLLGQNDHVLDAKRGSEGSGVTDLLELGASLEALRSRLGLEPFPLYVRLLASRGPVTANMPGEPKMARAWLDELHQENGS